MAGLLALNQDDPLFGANMALAAGLLQGNFGAGLQGFSGAMREGRQDAMRKQQFDLETEVKRMAIEKAKREAAQEQGLMGLQKQFFSAGAPGMAGTADVNSALPAEMQIGAMPPMAARQPQFDVKGYTGAAVNQGLMNPIDAIKLQQSMVKDAPINKLDVKDFTPASVAKFARTQNYADLERMDALHFGDTGGALVGLNKFTGQPVSSAAKTGNPFSDLLLSDGKGGMSPNSPLIGAKAAIARAGASNVSVTTKQEGEEAKAVGKFFGDNFADIQKSGFNAQNTINRYDRLGQLLEGVDTGKFAPLGLEVAKTAQAVGLNIDPKLSNKEAAVALSSEIALQLRNPSGGAGMPGAMSDADRNFLAGMVPGIEKTPEGRKQIIETAKKLAKRDMDVARMAREYRGKNGTINEGFYNELNRYSETNPLFAKPSAPSGGQAFSQMPAPNPSNKGKFLTDTVSGKRYRSSGFVWEEVK